MENWKRYLGIILIILSTICRLSIFILGILKLSVAQISAITTILIIFGEILFWAGTVLIGKELWIKFKKNLNPRYWFKK